MLLAPVWAAFLLGSRSARVLAGGGEWRWGPTASEAQGLLILSLLVGALYVINQIVDAPVDAANGKLFLLPRGLVSPRGAALEAGLLLGVAALLAARWTGPAERWLLGGALLVGTAYSVPPSRLKARAGWDVAANAVAYGGFSFALGWHAWGTPLGGETFRHALAYMFASGALFLLSTLEDLPGDAALGLGTSAVRFGPRGVRGGALLLAALGLAAALGAREWPAVIWSAVALPAYAWVWRSGDLSRGFLLNQLAGRLLVGLAVPGCGLLAGAIAAVFAASKVYYGLRFGLSYPRLRLAALGADERPLPSRGPSNVDMPPPGR